MTNIKKRFLKRYAVIHAYLKNHPFWPSLLTDGGMLTLMLILSICFTVLCGVRSVKDISPELKVIDIDFKGIHSLSYLDIGLWRNVADNVIVQYSLSDLIKDTRSKDDYLYDIWRTLSIEAIDTFKIGQINFYSNSIIDSIHTVPYVKTDKIRENGLYYTSLDSTSSNRHSNVFVSKRSERDVKKFVNIYYGNFFQTESSNPYIYLNLRISSSLDIDKTCTDSSAVIFSFSERDPILKETKSPVNIISVFPEPSYISPSYMIYKGEHLYKLIENNGFTFLGEDLGIKRKTDRANFLWTVLFGTSIALTIDILVHLIMKWRNLSGRKRRRKLIEQK